MTNEDAIKKQISMLREGYNIEIYPKIVDKLCNECDIENFKFATNNDLGYEQIHLTNLGINEPFHRASLIGFNTSNGPEWFLLDPTYGQFFENEIFKEYMFKHHKDFSIKLLNQGYIECTLLNIMRYIDGFINSFAFTNDIDNDYVYQEIEKLLFSNNIINKDLINTEKKLIELLKVRSNLLKQNEEQPDR